MLAAESKRDLGISELKNKVKVVCPPDVSKTNVKKIRKVTVLITSPAPLFGQTAEDLLAIKLRDIGFDVTERTEVSEATIKELNKYEKQAEKSEEKQQEEILDVIKIGKKLGLDAVLIGTLLDGRCQLNFPKENQPRVIEKIVVSTFHIQIIDVQAGKSVLSIILECDMGENITNAIDAMAKTIKEEIKD
jgi:hypothetical protein